MKKFSFLLFFSLTLIACSDNNSNDSDSYSEPESREKLYNECMKYVENDFTCDGCSPATEPRKRAYADSVFSNYNCREKERSYLIDACMYIRIHSK